MFFPIAVTNSWIGVTLFYLSLAGLAVFLVLVVRSMASPVGKIVWISSTLETDGYFRYVEMQSAFGRIKGRMEDHLDFYSPELNRTFALDPDDIVRGGVGTFLKEIQPFLERQGVRWKSLDNQYSEAGDYVVVVDGRTYRIVEAQERALPDEKLQMKALGRTFAAINRMLDNVNSPEQIWLLNRPEAPQAIFMHFRHHREIVRFARLPDAEKPLSPQQLHTLGT